ncbi:MAG TPA: hemolysin family protein [Gemmatimonadaceae bacterium]|nr:hemolysin family protein [Gemmatimonadaceae bacterium]
MLARLSAIVVLVLLNGYFVAAEFALVRSRRTRLEAMVRRGDRFARLALKATSNISGLMSASQLGVTLCSLGVGWVAQSVLRDILGTGAGMGSLALALAVAVAIGTAAFTHVVFGELVPKAIALQHPERIARWLLPGVLAFAWVTRPLVWVITLLSGLVLRLVGVDPTKGEENVHSPEELRLLVEQAQEGGAIEAQDADMIDAVLEFSEKSAREVMTPRTEIIALPLGATLEEVLAIEAESGFSRYPVYEETIDNIVGLVLAKDLLRSMRQPDQLFPLRTIMRPVHVVPGSRAVEDVLADFKRLKEHMAVVLDEYGGTAGIVTMEDLLEEIVGEILDEYDESEPEATSTGGGEAIVPGTTHVAELNERFGLAVSEDDYTTIGGFVFGTIGRLPVPGDRVAAGGAIFTVQTMEGRRIDSLSIDLHTLGDRREEPRDEPVGHIEESPR